MEYASFSHIIIHMDAPAVLSEFSRRSKTPTHSLGQSDCLTTHTLAILYTQLM